MSSCLSLSLIERAIIDILRGEDEDDDEEGGSCGRCIWCPTLATPDLYRLVPGSLGFRFTGGAYMVSHQHTL